MKKLPEFWQIRECKDYPGRCYYFNTVTLKSQWTRPTEGPNEKKPTEVYILHIIKKHNKSLKPVAKSGPITRSWKEAKKEIERIRQVLLNDISKFGEIANEESDTQDNESGGVVGWVKFSDIPKELHSIFTLEIDELSDIIESPLGFHLVLRKG